MMCRERSSVFFTGLLGSLAAVALLLGGCTGGGRDARPGVADGDSGQNPFQEQRQTVYSVTVTEVRERRMEDYIRINGDVVAKTSVSVYPDIEGKVSRILVRVGDYVHKDEPVVMVDPSKPGSSYRESPVKAPITGTVTDVLADLGESVSTNIPLVEMGSLDTLRVEAHVPERYIGSVAVGTRAVLSFEPYPGRQFSARVVELSPVLSASSRTLRVTLEYDDPENLVKAGMFAGIRLVTRVKEKVLAVPSDSVVARDGESVLFVLEEDGAGNQAETAGAGEPGAAGSRTAVNPTVAARRVQTGMSVDGMTEILDGLEPGDIVVTGGQTLLVDGAKVKVVESGDREGTGKSS